MRPHLAIAAVIGAGAMCMSCSSAGHPLNGPPAPQRALGPLTVCRSNPRYFSDPSGRAILLTGSHTWSSFQDWGTSSPPPTFDYPGYLAFLRRHSHNFFRLWRWEQTAEASGLPGRVWATPLAYLRTGPGRALDGELKFDVTRFNEPYFTRMRERVRGAGEQGIYVSVMLFNGWSVADKVPPPSGRDAGQHWGNPWRGHPFHRLNNINGIDGDLNRDEQGDEVHTLGDPRVVALEKAYVVKVIDTVGDLDNVLYEISNESDGRSRDWQYEMVAFVHAYEQRRPKQHPVGMSVCYPGGRNEDLWSSPAEWIAPKGSPADRYMDDPPASDGRKVVVVDTDHLWGVGGDADWAWKSFLRGLNPIFMDPYKTRLLRETVAIVEDPRADEQSQDPQLRAEWEALRRNLGYLRSFASRANLAALSPHPELASTGYCLADPGREYLVYLRRPRMPYRLLPSSVTVNLENVRTPLRAEWFSPVSGEVYRGDPVTTGGRQKLSAPFRGEAVLYLFR